MRVIANGVNRLPVSRSACGVLFCFGIQRYAAYFDFSRQNTTIQGQNFLILQLFLSTRIISISTGRRSLFRFSTIISPAAGERK